MPYLLHPGIVKTGSKIYFNSRFLDSLQTLSNGSHDLDEAQQRILASAIKSSYHSGVSLEGKQKERFNSIVQELAALSTKFR